MNIYKKYLKDSRRFLLIDLDNFKNLNDSLGHLAGDQALVDVANVLKNSFCDDAIISRFGEMNLWFL